MVYWLHYKWLPEEGRNPQTFFIGMWESSHSLSLESREQDTDYQLTQIGRHMPVLFNYQFSFIVIFTNSSTKGQPPTDSSSPRKFNLHTHYFCDLYNIQRTKIWGKIEPSPNFPGCFIPKPLIAHPSNPNPTPLPNQATAGARQTTETLFPSLQPARKYRLFKRFMQHFRIRRFWLWKCQIVAK